MTPAPRPIPTAWDRHHFAGPLSHEAARNAAKWSQPTEARMDAGGPGPIMHEHAIIVEHSP